jgi:hypothetical protein
MNNISYVKAPTFVVNANGKVVSDSVRADNTKGQKLIAVQTHNFESLKVALSWINKEGQKKSTSFYLYEIRPAAHGAYNVRCAIVPVKKTQAPRPSNNTAKANTIVNRTANATKNANANQNTTKPTNAKKTAVAKPNSNRTTKA